MLVDNSKQYTCGTLEKLNYNFLIEVAKENKKIIDRDPRTCTRQYIAQSGNKVDLTDSLENSIKNTEFYSNGPLDSEIKTSAKIAKIEVTNESATQSAQRLLSQGLDNIVMLNFASGICPGGGYVSGAQAQEEDIMRRSGLYNCVKSKPDFYNKNILASCDSSDAEASVNTDGIIYSPQVPFFRDEDYSLLEKPYFVSVISCPAIQFYNKINDYERYREVIKTRINKILLTAVRHSHCNLILGAWGCGAFNNDPEMIATIFAEEIKKYSFDNICFAVLDNKDGFPTFNLFKNKLELL